MLETSSFTLFLLAFGNHSAVVFRTWRCSWSPSNVSANTSADGPQDSTPNGSRCRPAPPPQGWSCATFLWGAAAIRFLFRENCVFVFLFIKMCHKHMMFDVLCSFGVMFPCRQIIVVDWIGPCSVFVQDKQVTLADDQERSKMSSQKGGWKNANDQKNMSSNHLRSQGPTHWAGVWSSFKPSDVQNCSYQHPWTRHAQNISHEANRKNMKKHHKSPRYRPSLPPALDDVTLRLAPGDTVAVVGRTGAGKTSLMLAILQLAPHSGEITIDDLPLKNLNEQACGRPWDDINIVDCFPVALKTWIDLNPGLLFCKDYGLWTNNQPRSKQIVVCSMDQCGGLLTYNWENMIQW